MGVKLPDVLGVQEMASLKGKLTATSESLGMIPGITQLGKNPNAGVLRVAPGCRKAGSRQVESACKGFCESSAWV